MNSVVDRSSVTGRKSKPLPFTMPDRASWPAREFMGSSGLKTSVADLLPIDVT